MTGSRYRSGNVRFRKTQYARMRPNEIVLFRHGDELVKSQSKSGTSFVSKYLEHWQSLMEKHAPTVLGIVKGVKIGAYFPVLLEEVKLA